MRKLTRDEVLKLAGQAYDAENPRQRSVLLEQLISSFLSDPDIDSSLQWFQKFRKHFMNLQLQDENPDERHHRDLTTRLEDCERKKNFLKLAVDALGTRDCAEWLERHLPKCCEWQDLRASGLTVKRLGGISAWAKVYIQDVVMRYEVKARIGKAGDGIKLPGYQES